MFIDQLKDIVDKAEDMLSEEVEGERPGALRDTLLQGSSPGEVGDEVRTKVIGEIFSENSQSKCLLFQTNKKVFKLKKKSFYFLVFLWFSRV